MNSSVAIKHLPEIFKKQSAEDRSINVFSAFGKTTNNLEKVLNAYREGNTRDSEKTLSELKVFHLQIARELFPEQHAVFGMIENIFGKIEKILSSVEENENPKFAYDQVVPFGEILAATIASEYLSFAHVSNELAHAIDFLKTDSSFTYANVDKKATLENFKKLAQHKNIITEGFIGICEGGMTTLGREGSDYTAGLLGNILDADKVILWKDVPGVMDKNPKHAGNEDAKKIDSMTYSELEKNLDTTAKGLVHPKTMNEVKEKNISLQVRPFWDLESKGTIIHI